MPSSDVLKRTPLHEVHRQMGARMVAFGGWEMPLEYTSITDEHLAVRARAGVFDASHMGEIEIAGPEALRGVQWITANDASRLEVGQTQYSALTTEEGTFVDDVLVYRLAESHFLIVVNAAHIAADYTWMAQALKAQAVDAATVNASGRYALIAVQGPAAEQVIAPLTAIDLAALKPRWCTFGEIAGVRVTISRTGYTGEDGFEIFLPPAHAEKMWRAVLAAGADLDIRPCGLGARDTLRLEAALRLCGQDMDEHTTVLEAGLGWIIGWRKGVFLGSDTLRAQKEAGLSRRLVAFEMVDRGIARHGYAILRAGAPCGIVTSGTQTPFLKKAIGFAMVPIDLATVGATLEIDIRGRPMRARIVPEPFYKRARPAAPAI